MPTILLLKYNTLTLDFGQGSCIMDPVMRKELKMKLKCKQCQGLFMKASESDSHKCVESLEGLSMEELLRLYNKPKSA